MSAFQEIFVPLCGLLGLRTLLRTWHGRDPKMSGALGTLIWCVAAMAIAFPEFTSRVAAAVGIGRGADMVFYLAILAGISVSFYFYQRNRQLENMITALMRRDAIKEARFGDGENGGEGDWG